MVIGDREERINLAPDFLFWVPPPAVIVGINPAAERWNGAGSGAQRVWHDRHDLWVRIEAGSNVRWRKGDFLRVRDDPTSGSGERSGALYIFEGEFYYKGKKRAILGQFLPAGCDTSCHHHRQTVEHFIPLLGTTYYWTPEQGLEPLERRTLIEREQSHYLRACSHSFTIIIMDGPYGLALTDHHYDEKPASRQ
ncbi:MAG: hypothetical protein HY372_03345 [Candidatus Andersenbacteria bacterium]|nr:hypothetical protein [Candidatus Andersenbacteria bacterium]